MKKLLCCLAACPWILFSSPHWEAKSEEEALFLRRIADFWAEREFLIAKGQMEEFLTAFPDSSFSDPLCAALGDLYLREKNYSRALTYYSQVSMPESYPYVSLGRMQCLYSLERYAPLADECDAFLKREQMEPSEQLHATYYLAIALYQQTLSAAKEPETLTKLAERAAPYFDALYQSDLKQEISQAFAHLCCILKNYPKAVSIYLDLANNQGQRDEEMLFQAGLIQAEYDRNLAASTFQEIAEMKGIKAKEALFNHLVLSFETGQFERLIEKKEELLREVPADRAPMAHLFLGRSLAALKDYSEACAELRAYLLSAAPCDTYRAALISLIEAGLQANDLDSLDFALSRLKEFYPEDPEIVKGTFSRAMVLKRGNRVDEARKALEGILTAGASTPQAAQALFELAHLDFQTKQWGLCHDKAEAFLHRYPESELTPLAWHYLVSAAAEAAAEAPHDRALKQQLVTNLLSLLDQKKGLSSSEQKAWQVLLAKTYFELDRFDEAASLIQRLLENQEPFSGRANALLLLALCHRNHSGDLSQFCLLAEEAIQGGANLIDRGALHVFLFNAYLERSKEDGNLLEKGAEHLLAAFECKAALQPTNIFWLADFYFHRLEQDEEDGLPLSEKLMHRMVALLEQIGSTVEPESLSAESIDCKLGRVYSLLGQYDRAAALLTRLTEKYRKSPDLNWQNRDLARLLLGEVYAAVGKEEEAVSLFDAVANERSTLRTRSGAAACLQSVRIQAKEWAKQRRSLEDPVYLSAVTRLKNLILQKNLAHEPLYLEAALDYIDLQTSQSETPDSKRLSLLAKIREDFESKEDILAKDYHEARLRAPRKNQIYQAYMQLFEAEILALQGRLSEDPDAQKELQAKSKDLLLQIAKESVHPALTARIAKVCKRLE